MEDPPHDDLEAARPGPPKDQTTGFQAFLRRNAGELGLIATLLSATAAAVAAWAAVKQAQLADIVASYQSASTLFPFTTREIEKSTTGYERMLAICGHEADIIAITDAKSIWQFAVRLTRMKNEDDDTGIISVPVAIDLDSEKKTTLGAVEPKIFEKERRCRGIFPPNSETMSAFGDWVVKRMGPGWYSRPFDMEGLLRITHRDALGNPQTRYLRIYDTATGHQNHAASQAEASQWIEQNSKLRSEGFSTANSDADELVANVIRGKAR